MYNAHFFNQNVNIKTGGAHYMWVYLYMCGCVEKYHICGLKVGVGVICGCPLYMGIYGKYTGVSALIGPSEWVVLLAA